jgi:hypothetical protein
MDCDTWASPEDPDQRLVVLTAELGSASEEALRILGSWTANVARHPPLSRCIEKAEDQR